ncbi:hypothetical protein, partial [Hymenobacter agri]
EVLAALEAETNTPLALLAAARQAQQISPRCYEVLTAEVEQRLLYWASQALEFHFQNPAKADLHLQMPDAEARRLAQALYARYDPAQPRYRYSSLNNLGIIAGLRAQGVLPGPTPAARTWAGYETPFAAVYGNFSRFDYLTPASQSLAVGNIFLTALSFNTLSPADAARAFVDYRQLFPASPYVPIIARVLPKATAPAAAGQNLTLGRLAPGAHALAFA